MTTSFPTSNKWTEFQRNIYVAGKPPLLGTVDMKEIEENAREKMKDHIGSYLYTSGSAGSNSTDKANRAALDRWKIVPRLLQDVSNRSIETTILGVKYEAPVFVAPVGVQGILHQDGELASAAAAAACGVPYIMSTASSRSIEEVAQANGSGQRWYQLYWPRTSEVTVSLLHRAKAAGFTTLVITLDTFVLGWRPHDIKTAFLPFGYGVGSQVGTSDPVFMQRHGLQPRHERPAFPFEPEKIRAQAEAGDEKVQEAMKLGISFLGETNSGAFRGWEDLRFVQQHWDGPIVIKGVQRASDAEKAIEMGLAGIVVSNHGGRQVDGALGSLDALDRVMRSPRVLEAQKSGKFAVLFDSGVRNGSDVIKALALGAQAVLIGRPFMYGLALEGQKGVEQILMQTVADLHVTLGLAGFGSVEEIIGAREEVLTDIGY